MQLSHADTETTSTVTGRRENRPLGVTTGEYRISGETWKMGYRKAGHHPRQHRTSLVIRGGRS